MKTFSLAFSFFLGNLSERNGGSVSVSNEIGQWKLWPLIGESK